MEWELQLIDCDDENLRQCGDWVIDQLHRAHPDTPLVHGEMLRNTVELVSRKQFSVAACAADLQEGIEAATPGARAATHRPGQRRLTPLC